MATRSRDRSEVSLCVKYFLFFINFFIMVISLTGFSIGIWIFVIKQKSIASGLDLVLDLTFWVLLFGFIFALISIFGCFGALREQITFLKIYHWTITLGIILELVFILFVFLFYFQPETLKQLKFYPEDLFKDGIKKYPDVDEDVNDFIELLQQNIGCCGFSNDDEGYKQWGNNMYFNCSDDNISPLKCGVPESCCKYQIGERKNLFCGQDVAKKSPSEVSGKIYTRGCLKGFGDIIGGNSILLGVIIAVVLIVEMMAIYYAKNLIFQIEQQISKWRYNLR